MAFVGLEAGLKIDDFSGFPGGTPELRQRTSGVVKVLLPPPLLSFRQRTSGVVKVLLPPPLLSFRQRTSGWLKFFSGGQENNIHIDTIPQS